MATAKSDLLQGTLDMLILQVAALGPLHGYAIAQRLQQISKDILQVQQGSLYPALGRDAKFYGLTRAGRRQLESERANWERLTQAIALVLSTAQ
jgi:PadR family transcriptional regulator PadR